MNFTPVDGWMCLKCGRRECAVTPSGLVVVCAFCPWEECVPCMVYALHEEKKYTRRSILIQSWFLKGIPKMESIRPGVVINGKTFYPPGWMYLLAYAIRGFDWAIKDLEKSEVKQQIKDYLKEKKIHEIDEEITNTKEWLQELQQRLNQLETQKRGLDT